MLEVVSGTKEQRSDEEMSNKSRLSRNDDKKETFFLLDNFFSLQRNIHSLFFLLQVICGSDQVKYQLKGNNKEKERKFFLRTHNVEKSNDIVNPYCQCLSYMFNHFCCVKFLLPKGCLIQ